jgi:hypothetical protein
LPNITPRPQPSVGILPNALIIFFIFFVLIVGKTHHYSGFSYLMMVLTNTHYGNGGVRTSISFSCLCETVNFLLLSVSI